MTPVKIEVPPELAGRVCTVKIAYHGHFHVTSLYPTVGLSENERMDEMELILEYLSHVPEPRVVASDFQEDLSLEFVHRWAHQLNLVPIHIVEPTCMGSRLDGFFVTKQLAAQKALAVLDPWSVVTPHSCVQLRWTHGMEKEKVSVYRTFPKLPTKVPQPQLPPPKYQLGDITTLMQLQEEWIKWNAVAATWLHECDGTTPTTSSCTRGSALVQKKVTLEQIYSTAPDASDNAELRAWRHLHNRLQRDAPLKDAHKVFPTQTRVTRDEMTFTPQQWIATFDMDHQADRDDMKMAVQQHVHKAMMEEKKSKSKSWREWCVAAFTTATHGWKYLKQQFAQEITPQRRGQPLVGTQALKTVTAPWLELWNEHAEHDICDVPLQTLELPTYEDMMHVLRRYPKKKAIGVDGWSLANWAALPEVLTRALHQLVCRTEELAYTPTAWATKVVLIPKPGVAEKRPIAMTAAPWRLIGRMRQRLIRQKVKKWCFDAHAGTKNRGCVLACSIYNAWAEASQARDKRL
eukprot:4250832-Amphidinium_carterae.1